MNAPTARLEHFPVPLFAAVMGIGGLSLAWRRVERVYDVPDGAATALYWASLVLFVLLLGAYVAKWMLHFRAALAEARHPMRMVFVPTVTIAALVVATAGQETLTGLSRVMWWAGAVGHLALTVLTLSSWFNRDDIGLAQMTPAWFIPVVGNIVTPLAADAIGSVEFAWFAFGVGIVFWVALLPLLLFRLLLHGDPMPPKMLPTLAIFVAPPAVAGLAWIALTGSVRSPLTRILDAATLMFVALVAAQLPRLRRIPFSVAWWAYTFPAAAAAGFALAMAAAHPAVAYDVIAIGLLALATVLVLGVAALTARAAAAGRICVPD